MRRWMLVGLVVVLVGTLTGIIVSVAGSNKSPSATGGTSASSATTTTPTTIGPAITTTTIPVTTTTTAGAPAGKVLLVAPGSGNDVTSRFTIAAGAPEWYVRWAFSCSGVPSTFNYQVDRGTAQDVSDLGPKAQGTGTFGIEHYHDTGSFTLSIASGCIWAVSVTQVNS